MSNVLEAIRKLKL